MSFARDLFDYIPEPDITANRHKGNAQSVSAFEKLKPTAAEKREQVFQFVKSMGTEGATTDQIAYISGLPANEVSPRMSDLKKEGRIVPTGYIRKTRRGQKAEVFRVAEGK